MTFLSQNQECLRDSSVTLDLSESVQSILGRGLSLLLLAAYSTFFSKVRVVVSCLPQSLIPEAFDVQQLRHVLTGCFPQREDS